MLIFIALFYSLLIVILLMFCLIPLLLLGLLIKFIRLKKFKSLYNKHVVITGGSSGIGKSVAIISAKMGAHVTIIARGLDKLNIAKEEIQKSTISSKQIITAISTDVTVRETIFKLLMEIDDTIAPIYMLVNCAGFAVCGRFEQMNDEIIRKLIDVNILGSVYPIKAVIPKMKERNEGIIVLTGSQVSLMGMFGYSVYSSCKFAIRGLAESLLMELKPFNISVTLSLPPDTDTPGFENENKSKPEETKLISQTAGLFKPEEVATQLLDDALAGNFFNYIGFESFVLSTLCVGMGQYSSFFELSLQLILLGPLRILGAFYMMSFDKIIKKYHSNEKKTR